MENEKGPKKILEEPDSLFLLHIKIPIFIQRKEVCRCGYLAITEVLSSPCHQWEKGLKVVKLWEGLLEGNLLEQASALFSFLCLFYTESVK